MVVFDDDNTILKTLDFQQPTSWLATQLTHDPEGLIEFQRKITEQNVSDPDPPGWSAFLLGTHPTAVQRIGQALAFSRRSRDAGSRGGS